MRLTGKEMTRKEAVTLLCWQLQLEFNDKDISGSVGDRQWGLLIWARVQTLSQLINLYLRLPTLVTIFKVTVSAF